MEKQDWRGKQLDKDILFLGNKVYSPETCVFVDQLTNCFINERAASRGDTMIGVNYHSRDMKYQARCSNPFTKKSDFLGYFDSEIDAHNEWKRRKLELAYAVSEAQTDKRISAALIARYS